MPENGHEAACPSAPPLILTLAVAEPAQARFETLRHRHFPPARNVVPAHLTLFHALPADGADEVAAALSPFGTARFPVEVTGLLPLGRGVAFALAGDALRERREAVRRRFAGRLTRQDAAPWRPHVTIQNKVTPEAASAVLADLAAGFEPFTTEAAAFHLWAYLGGPWEQVLTVGLGTAAPGNA